MVKNKEIYFIRHGKLLLNYKNHADMPMHILADLASNKIDPPIEYLFLKKYIKKLSKIIPLDELDVIYSSPSRRCKDTANFIKNYVKKKTNKKVSIVTSLALKEVWFDLYKIYENKKNFSFMNLNGNIFRAMIAGTGSEPVKTVQMRAYQFMKKIKKSKSKKILVISHDFVMRVIEIYAKRHATKKTIDLKDLKKTRRNDYLNGFKMSKDFKKVAPIIF